MEVEDPERVCHPEEPDARNAVSAERFVGRLVDVACNGWGGLWADSDDWITGIITGHISKVKRNQARGMVFKFVIRFSPVANIWYSTDLIIKMINVGAALTIPKNSCEAWAQPLHV